MANEWDQFKPVTAAPANEWDQFKAVTPAKPSLGPAKPKGLSAEGQAYRVEGAQGAPGMGEEFLGGLKSSFDQAAMGLKSALPESVQRAGDWVDEKVTGKKVMTPELIEQGKKFEEGTGAASTVGKFAGELGMGAAATGGLGAIGAGVRGLPLAIEAAGNAGWSALTSPDDRTGAAIGGGLGTVGGKLLSETLGGAAKVGRKVAGYVLPDSAYARSCGYPSRSGPGKDLGPRGVLQGHSEARATRTLSATPDHGGGGG